MRQAVVVAMTPRVSRGDNYLPIPSLSGDLWIVWTDWLAGWPLARCPGHVRAPTQPGQAEAGGDSTMGRRIDVLVELAKTTSASLVSAASFGAFWNPDAPPPLPLQMRSHFGPMKSHFARTSARVFTQPHVA